MSNWLEDLGKDLRHSARSLFANPVFACVAVITLALGIGANAAIFSVMNAVVLRSLPVHDANRLVGLRIPNQPDGANNTGSSDSSFSEYTFEQMRANQKAFSDLIAYVPLSIGKVTVRSGSTPEVAAADMVSGNFFSGIGVSPICGRTLSTSDETNHAAVAVLSYGYWNRRFAGSCGVVGQPLFIKGVPFTIVGVSAEGFTGLESTATDLWIPLQTRPELNAWGSTDESLYRSPNWWCLLLLGRLAPGVTDAQAIAQLNPILQHAAYEPLGGKPRPGERPITLSFRPVRGIAGADEEFEKPLRILLGMVMIVLVIACANVSLLLAARNTARQREFSVRLALGGSSFRLFRQLLAESLLLVCLGAVLGWLFAIGATRAMAAWSDIDVSLAPDKRVLLFTLGISLLAGLVFGLAPLLSSLRVPIALALKTSSATAFQDRGKLRFGRLVAALQVSLCLPLLVGAGLLIRTLHNLESVQLGFHASGLLVFGLSPSLPSHSDAAAISFYRAVLARLKSLPGIQAATLMQNRIGSGWSNNTSAVLDGSNPKNVSPQMRWNAVGPDYFGTLGISLHGRDFNDADSQNAQKVAVVNQTFADKFLPGRDPLGHQVSFTGKFSYTIVGIAANSKYTGVRESETPMAYFPYTQVPGIGELHVELRTAAMPEQFLPSVRKSLAAFAPDLALLQPMTQRTQFDSSISEERLVARLSMFFGILAAVLVATGLYGTLAYAVARRTSEVGVRMALGAQRHEVLWMILRESLAVCTAGLMAGLLLVIASAHLLGSLLYGLAPHDPLTIVIASLGIVAVNILASLIPARRAASVNPIVALRYE